MITNITSDNSPMMTYHTEYGIKRDIGTEDVRVESLMVVVMVVVIGGGRICKGVVLDLVVLVVDLVVGGERKRVVVVFSVVVERLAVGVGVGAGVAINYISSKQPSVALVYVL